MGTSKTLPSASMFKAGNEKINNDVFATERGWERDLGNGQTELLHAISGLKTSITSAVISSITFQRKRNLSIAGGDQVIMKAHYTEPVTLLNGEVTDITLTEAGSGYYVSDHDRQVTIAVPSTEGGSPAEAFMIVESDHGIGAIAILEAGSGYTTADDHGAVVAFVAPEGGTVAEGTLIVEADVVVGVAITASGDGYAVDDDIILPDPTGGGDTATARVREITGTVTGVNITEAGSGYVGTELVAFPSPIDGGVTTTGELVVNAIGAPTIGFDEDGVAVTATFDRSLSDDNTLVFKYTVTAEGAIDNFDSALGGSATIVDSDDNAVNQDFPADFTPPTMTVIA